MENGLRGSAPPLAMPAEKTRSNKVEQSNKTHRIAQMRCVDEEEDEDAN